MATFVQHPGKKWEGITALQVQDLRAETAGTEIPPCLSHLHILTSVDEAFDHFDATDDLETFMCEQEAFTGRLMQVIWKHRASSMIESQKTKSG